ncbi:hypothetical protein ACWDPV_03165 [Gordonia sp. NPDC003504]
MELPGDTADTAVSDDAEQAGQTAAESNRMLPRPWAVALGALTGLALAAVLVATALTVLNDPAWHRTSDSVSGPLGTDAVILAVITIVMVIGFLGLSVVARVPRWVPLVFVLATCAIAFVALIAFNPDSSRNETADEIARTAQVFPHVLNMPSGSRYVFWTCVVVTSGMVAVAVAAYVRRAGRPERSWFLGATVTVALVATAVGAVIVWPETPGPERTGEGSGGIAFQQPQYLIGKFTAIRPSDESRNARLYSPVVLPVGFAVIDGESVLARSGHTGDRVWSVDFGAEVSAMWSSEVTQGGDTTAILAQVAYTPWSPITYGIDGTNGNILWSSDDFGPILDAAGSADVMVAMVEDRGESVTGDATDVDRDGDDDVSDDSAAQTKPTTLKRIDMTSGNWTSLKAYGPSRTCQYDGHVHSDGYEAAIAETCVDPRGMRIARFSLGSNEYVEPITPDLLGFYDGDARISIADMRSRSMLITVTGADPGTDKSVVYGTEIGSARVALPAGYRGTDILAGIGAYSYTVAAQAPNGTSAVIVSDLSESPARSTITPTDTMAGDESGHWAATGDALFTTGVYREPPEFSADTGYARQIAPLTILRNAPIGPASQRMSIQIAPSPCPQLKSDANGLLTVGGGVLFFCAAGLGMQPVLYLMS